MIDNPNIMIISYPSGGFGNFLFHVLTEFADNTYKPTKNLFEFSADGNSHSTNKYTKIYFHDPEDYNTDFPVTDKKILILCDNGINNDSYVNVRKTFPAALILRATICKSIRPVIYQTCIVKAKNSRVVEENHQQVLDNWSDSNEDYAIRENFTLMYHNWNYGWECSNESNVINIELESLINDPAETIVGIVKQLGGQIIDHKKLVELCRLWQEANSKYFKVYFDWIRINYALDNQESVDISNITDLHEQGYLNYCIEYKYNVTIPVYTYRNWFKTTADIQEMILCLK
jgi:hypothetical protein